MADDFSENAGSHDPCPEVMSGVLRDGFHVLIRPLRTSDRNQLAGGFLLLSERSRYLRFLTGVDHLSDSDLDVLIDQVDQHDHVALAMLWQRAARPRWGGAC